MVLEKIIPDIGVGLGRNFLDLKKKIRDNILTPGTFFITSADNDDIHEWLHFGIDEQGLNSWHMIK